MKHELSDETKRRLALGLVDQPRNANRMRRKRKAQSAAMSLAAVLIGCAVLAAAYILTELSK